MRITHLRALPALTPRRLCFSGLSMLSGASAILIASADLALVRILRAAANPIGIGSTPILTPGERLYFSRQPAVIYSPSDPIVLGAAPNTYTASRPVLAPNPTSLAAPPANLASDPLPAPDPGAVSIHANGTPRNHSLTPLDSHDQVAPTSAAQKAHYPVKVAFGRTDTVTKGAMIDFFC